MAKVGLEQRFHISEMALELVGRRLSTAPVPSLSSLQEEATDFETTRPMALTVPSLGDKVVKLGLGLCAAQFIRATSPQTPESRRSALIGGQPTSLRKRRYFVHALVPLPCARKPYGAQVESFWFAGRWEGFREY